MRARDRAGCPTAPHDGTYGCRKCGTYARLKQGNKLACSWCRTTLPLIATGAPAGQPGDDTQAPPQSSRPTGKAEGRNG